MRAGSPTAQDFRLMNEADCTTLEPAFKPTLTARRRVARFLQSILDPRVYLHGFRLLNHYNQTHVIPRRELSLGPDAAISPTCQFANASRIRLGARAHVGSGCYLWAGPKYGLIEAGDDLLLGPDVMITAASYRFRDGSPTTDQSMEEASIRIGRNVWIGARAIILPGVQIGDGAVVAAGAVVSRNIGAGEVFAGVPARVIGRR